MIQSQVVHALRHTQIKLHDRSIISLDVPLWKHKPTTGVPKFTASAYGPTYLRFMRMFRLVFEQGSEAGSAKIKEWVSSSPLGRPSSCHTRRRALTPASRTFASLTCRLGTIVFPPVLKRKRDSDDAGDRDSDDEDEDDGEDRDTDREEQGQQSARDVGVLFG